MQAFHVTTERRTTAADVAFEAGYAAYWARVAPDNNPHAFGTNEFRPWDDGWSQASLDDGESTAEQ